MRSAHNAAIVNPMAHDRRSYSTPAVVVVGTVAEVTQGMHHVPTSLDATFPAGTPHGQLTYS